jgi:act minimal PKS chain-length factor (CLF/KS beta)
MSRAVVTGLGVLAPTGVGAAEHWDALLAGRSGIATITRFDASRYPVRLAGEVPGFHAADHVPAQLIVQTARFTHLGLAAAAMALADAGLGPAELTGLDAYQLGVTTCSSSGGAEFGQREIQALWRDGPDHVGTYQSIAWFYAATTGQVSIRHGLRGPCGVLATEQAGGLDALGQARRMLDDGTHLVLAGGADASLSPYGLVTQLPNGRLSRCDDPARAYLPFDVQACGYVPGEGAAMFVLERPDAYRERGGCGGYGEVLGYAATFDPAPASGRPPVLRRAIDAALRDAGLDPADIDVVFADAAGVPELDRAEVRALAEVFGPGAVPVTAPKTMTGRLYAGGAALDVATALLALRTQVIPPTLGVDRLADGYALDLVRDEPRAVPLRTALVVARGCGGFNSALVVAADRRGSTSHHTSDNALEER